MPKITFIKLGGSLITDKSRPEKFHRVFVKQIVKEIKKYRQAKPKDELLLIGHGAGSFGHIPAKKYQTKKGLINQNSRQGMAITQDAVARLNRLIVNCFLQQNLAAVSWPISANGLATKNRRRLDLSILLHYWRIGLLPIVYGDVIADQNQGCTIWSTETIFHVIIDHLPKSHQPARIIHLTDVDGVLDRNQQTIALINQSDFSLLSQHKKTNGADVTGGMYHKIQASLKMAQEKKIASFIINGQKRNNLLNCLQNHPYQGTKIHLF